jgi:hypothetical protein
MKRLLLLLLPVLCVLGLGGCQCSPLTEHYTDAIDHVADREPCLDALYHPCFDLTRIGQPDWCSCGFNRLWCHWGCCKPHCGEPCPALCCPFCLPEQPVAAAPPAAPAKVTPELPPAPKPPAEAESR